MDNPTPLSSPTPALDTTPVSFSMESVTAAVAAWCARRPTWISIADMPSGMSRDIYVQWHELKPFEKKYWESEYGYNEYAPKKCKVKSGFITGDGTFHETFNDIQPRQNFCMVFAIGREQVEAIRAKQLQYTTAVQTWLSQNPEWMCSRDFSSKGYALMSEQWGELTPAEQAKWGDKQRYDGSGCKRHKYVTGHISEEGFVSHYRDLPKGEDAKHDFVVKVGLDHAPFRKAGIPPTAPVNKALSIQQPWAWLIANGHKDIENRTWKTKHRGEFYIHAGKKIDMDGYRWVTEHFPHISLPIPDALELGGIVGKVNLTECHAPQSPGVSPWHFEDCFGFRVENAQVLPFQAVKGQLNFFSVKPE